MTAPATTLTAAACITEAVRRLIKNFHPMQIILFGSRAKGTETLDSDADLLIVLDHVDDRMAQTAAMLALLADLPLAKDLHVTDAATLARYGSVPGTVERWALREGKVLHG